MGKEIFEIIKRKKLRCFLIGAKFIIPGLDPRFNKGKNEIRYGNVYGFNYFCKYLKDFLNSSSIE
jgi:hypothetical protein